MVSVRAVVLAVLLLTAEVAVAALLVLVLVFGERG